VNKLPARPLPVTRAIRALYPGEFKAPSLPLSGHLRQLRDSWREFVVYLKRNPWSLRAAVMAPVLAVSILAWGLIRYYNLFSTGLSFCQLYYAEVGVELKRRENLIPNLALCVESYSEHERGVMKHVSDARQVIVSSGNMDVKIAAAKEIQGILASLMATVEAYPNVKASETTQTLLQELATTENRIADWKGKYNESARSYNNLQTSFPSNIFGYLFYFRDPVRYLATAEDVLKAGLLNFDGTPAH
jgi:LemA protein